MGNMAETEILRIKGDVRNSGPHYGWGEVTPEMLAQVIWLLFFIFFHTKD